MHSSLKRKVYHGGVPITINRRLEFTYCSRKSENICRVGRFLLLRAKNSSKKWSSCWSKGQVCWRILFYCFYNRMYRITGVILTAFRESLRQLLGAFSLSEPFLEILGPYNFCLELVFNQTTLKLSTFGHDIVP